MGTGRGLDETTVCDCRLCGVSCRCPPIRLRNGMPSARRTSRRASSGQPTPVPFLGGEPCRCEPLTSTNARRCHQTVRHGVNVVARRVESEVVLEFELQVLADLGPALPWTAEKRATHRPPRPSLAGLRSKRPARDHFDAPSTSSEFPRLPTASLLVTSVSIHHHFDIRDSG
jgi:hypothetical protein